MLVLPCNFSNLFIVLMVFAIKSAVWYLVVMVTIDDDDGGGSG